MSGRGPGRGRMPPGAGRPAGGTGTPPKRAGAGGARDGSAAGPRAVKHGGLANAKGTVPARLSRASHSVPRQAGEQLLPDAKRVPGARPFLKRPPFGAAVPGQGTGSPKRNADRAAQERQDTGRTGGPPVRQAGSDRPVAAGKAHGPGATQPDKGNREPGRLDADHLRTSRPRAVRLVGRTDFLPAPADKEEPARRKTAGSATGAADATPPETRASSADAPKGPGALRRSRPVRQTRSHAAKPVASASTAAAAPGETPPAAERGERIAKWLARAGVASRRDAEKLLAEGKVRVNNAVITHPATFVAAGDLVQVAGALVDAPGRARLWRYHKPDGLVTTHRDPEGRDTVFAALPPGMPRVVSIGRLDLNSEGLLLLTNDGGLARRLEMPANGWLRRYRVRVYGVVDEAALAGLASGIEIDGVRYGPIEAGLDSRKGNNGWVTVGLREGRNREVRRVMEHLGLRVTRLIRVAYGPFQLGLLTRGSVEEVTAKVLREQIPDL